MNRKAHVASKLKTEGLLKVTGGHVHRKCGNISETAQGRAAATNHRQDVIYGLSNDRNSDDLNLQGHSLLQVFSNVIFVQLRSSWQDFNWQSASRGPSTIAKLLVHFPFTTCIINECQNNNNVRVSQQGLESESYFLNPESESHKKWGLRIPGMDVLSPFISVLCHSDWLFHEESFLCTDVVHPGRAWSSSPTCTWHCSLHYFFLRATPLFPHGVTIVC